VILNARVLWLRDELGLSKGERVALRVSSSIATVETIFACLKLGLELLLLPEKGAREEIERLLTLAQPKRVLSEKSGLDPEVETTKIPESFEKVEESFQLDLESLVLFPTSGSSGPSKVVVHKLACLIEVARASNELTGLEQNGVWLLTLPLNHVGGFSILLRTTLAQAKLAVPRVRGLSSLASNVVAFSPSHISLVPVMLQELLKSDKELDFSSLKAVLVSGDALEGTLRQSAVAAGIPVLSSYGSTEAGSTAVSNSILDKDPSAPVYNNRLAGIEVRLSEDGEILLSGPNMFSGYLSPEIETETETEWFGTGDLGEIDEEGGLKVTGRRSRILVSGGENIHPEEIERVVLAISGVEDVLVIAEDSEKWGERPVLLVKAADTGSKFEEVIRAEMQRSLSSFKIPSEIRFVGEFSYLDSMKKSYRT